MTTSGPSPTTAGGWPTCAASYRKGRSPWLSSTWRAARAGTCAASAAPIRWSADDSRLILGVYELQNGERPQSITASAVPGGTAEQLLLDYAELIEVVDYPPR